MKLRLTAIAIIALALAGCEAAMAQDTNAPTTPENFIQSVEAFLATNPTNNTFIGNKLELQTGGDYENGIQWANNIKVGYNIDDTWQAQAKMRNAGVAGTVISYEGGVSYAILNSYSIKAEAYLDIGYSHQYATSEIEPGVEFKKKMTPNTYAYVGMSEPIYVRRHNVPNPWWPTFDIGAGVTF